MASPAGSRSTTSHTVHPTPDTLGIDSDKFKCLIYVATTLKLGGLISAAYCNGYHCGLSRLRHGEKFATPAKHQRWSRMGLNGIPREEFGRGYRDAFAGRDLRQMFTATD